MTDRLSKARRSWNMSRIRSKNTKPELVVRSALHRLGYRFRLHVQSLPGCPDIVLPKWNTAILVHGCFWHRHQNCPFAYTPKTRKAFWIKKFRDNSRRDLKKSDALAALGWRVVVIWECETRDEKILASHLCSILRF
jgi:DNA mismatch endonuclease (patch repair protein)